MKKEEIHILIDRYFDAELSLKEEQELLNLLLLEDSDDPEIREALAVMTAEHVNTSTSPSYGPVKSGNLKTLHTQKRHSLGKWIGAAAAFVAIVSIGAALFVSEKENSNGDMFAYSESVKIEDKAQIFNIINSQLEDIVIAYEDLSSEVADDLDDISRILNNKDI